MSKKDYIERTLIKLKREYGKDELVSTLLKQISEKDIELGKLRSEIDYLQNELEIDKEQKEINRTARVEARKDELYRMKIEHIKSQRLKIKKLRSLNSDLIAKNYALKKMNLITEIKTVIKHHTYRITDENGNKWEVLELSDITILLDEAETQSC